MDKQNLYETKQLDKYAEEYQPVLLVDDGDNVYCGYFAKVDVGVYTVLPVDIKKRYKYPNFYRSTIKNIVNVNTLCILPATLAEEVNFGRHSPDSRLPLKKFIELCDRAGVKIY